MARNPAEKVLKAIVDSVRYLEREARKAGLQRASILLNKTVADLESPKPPANDQ